MADKMEHEEIEDISKPEVFQKYRTASEVLNLVLGKVVADCQPGKRILDICRNSDALLEAELIKKAPKKGEEDDHGISFPTCVSVNNCAGHFSPLSDDAAKLAAGDLVKIDMGVHVDGFCAVAAHTLIVPGGDLEVTDRRADVIIAAYGALQAAARSLRPGVKNSEISDIIERAAKAYGVSAMEGVLSHAMHRYVIDGAKVIMNKPTTEQRVDEYEVEAYDVWALDISMSTGEGKARESGEQRTTVFKRNPDQQYLLKLKASRQMLTEINNRFAAFPFTLRALSDEKRAKLAVTEMVTHGLVDSYPVLHEKAGEFVAQFKATVLVLPDTTTIATGLLPPPAQAKSEKTPVAMADEVLRAAVAKPLTPIAEAAALVAKKKKSGKKKKAKKAKAAASSSEAAAAPAAAPAPMDVAQQ